MFALTKKQSRHEPDIISGSITIAIQGNQRAAEAARECLKKLLDTPPTNKKGLL